MTSEEMDLRRVDDAHRAVIEHRLTSLERKVDSGFQSLQETILATSATFVRLDLYLSERDTLREDNKDAKKLAMWAIGLIASVTIGAIVLGILSMSGAF